MGPGTWFSRFAIFVLVYMFPVVMWGVVTRATFSGDGCGTHWPLCHGQLIPFGLPVESWVEWSHRLSSGLAGPLVVALLVLAYRASVKGSQLRKAALGSFFFTLTEGGIGAKLVLKDLVADNPSMVRAFWTGAHLANTFILLGFLTWTVWLALGKPAIRLRGQGPVMGAVALGLFLMLFLGVTGSIAALGSMLYPAGSLAEKLRQDFDAASPLLVRLRLGHPLIATSVGLYIVFLASYLTRVRPTDSMVKSARWMVGLFGLQMIWGLSTLLTKSPLVLQVGHLLLADLLWVVTLWAGAQALSTGRESVPGAESEAAHSGGVSRSGLMHAYIALTKPRVISLLLFTTITAAFVAAKGWPGGWLLLALLVGGYFSAGAANAINMVYDRDIDVRMKRTSSRPTVTQQITNAQALTFAFVLQTISFAVLWSVANLLTAFLALAGLLFYVFVYTMALKRRTWQNIVIGGAAGAFPPLVGYAGVTGYLSPVAWILFGIIFLWTPVHFWALALLIKDDYKDAGVPMLPCVRGDHYTVVQIMVYTVLTVAISLAPLFMGEAGMYYAVAAVVLNAALFVRAMNLYHRPERQEAKVLFKYSMVYLAALFLMFAIDRSWLA